MQQDRDFTAEDREKINPGNALSISTALDFVKNPVKCCEHVQDLIQRLMDIVRIKKDDPKTKGTSYPSSWETPFETRLDTEHETYQYKQNCAIEMCKSFYFKLKHLLILSF
jgi:hypothetical protein